MRESHPDNLWLNAGDEFQGTLFYSFYGPEKIAETINQLGFDAMTLGNHEWDGGDEELGEFLTNLTFPVISCNVKSEYEGLNKTIKNYEIFEDYDLAVIGVTTDTTPSLSAHVGNLTTFLDPITEVQKSIWEIRNNTDIKRIVALTHIGYDVDQKLAAETEGLSLIIGGHSHTPLGDIRNSAGDYPTIVEDLSGNEVFIVTAYRWGEYLGYIDMTFDENGRALEYHGGPIHMDNKTIPDADLEEQVKSWRGPFEEFAAERVGETPVELDQASCWEGDCLLGQVMTDAMLEYRMNQTEGSDERPDFALINSGGIRATIDAGEITRGEVLTSFPFGNAIVELTYSGADLKTILEGALAGWNLNNNKAISSWFQVSRGIKIEYNPSNNNGSKIISLKVGDEDLDEARDYRVVTLDFLAGGGDNIFEKQTEYISLDTQDEVLVMYLNAHDPIEAELEERIVETNSTTPEEGGSDGGDGGSGGNGDGGENQDGDNGNGGPNAASGVTASSAVAAVVAMAVVMLTV